MLLGLLGASLQGNILAGKGIELEELLELVMGIKKVKQKQKDKIMKTKCISNAASSLN